jgi:O-antigen/teichoic acid export membrane protein
MGISSARAIDRRMRASVSGAEIKQRAVAGAGLVAIRAVAIRVIGLAGTVILARLLTPRDFGVVALGAAILTFAQYIADGGVGAALIRGREQPELAELRAFLGIQLMATSAFALVVIAAAYPLGLEGRVVAVMAMSLPIIALRGPGSILLERELAYRPLALIEIAEMGSYFGWAIATIATLHWGVWGLATGSVVRAAVGSGAVAVLSPIGIPRPSLAWSRVRSHLGFGLRFQGSGLLLSLRDQGINVSTLAIAGVPVLGIWSLTSKVMTAPFVLFETLWRISYPAMSRLMAVGENCRPIIERGVGLVATATGAILSPLVAASPALIPSVFGSRWHGVVAVLPWASIGLLISGPISVACSGYLYAAGDAATPLRSTVLNSAAFFIVALPLLPELGAAALGLGWMVSAIVESFVLGRAVHVHCGAALVAPLKRPVAAALVSGGGGWLIASITGESLLGGFFAAVLALCSYVLILFVAQRDLVLGLLGLIDRTLRVNLARA